MQSFAQPAEGRGWQKTGPPGMPKSLKWAYYYLGHRFSAPPAPMHFEWVRMAEESNRLVIAAPREFAKSTVLNMGLCLYSVLELHYRMVLIVSATSELATYWLGEINDELSKNEKILRDYPFLLSRKSSRTTSKTDKPNWEAQQHEFIKLPNGSQIRARGWKQVRRGLHPQLTICDDLEDDQEVSSDIQREKMFSKFRKTLLGMISMDKDARLIMIGNYLHHFCLLKKIIDNNVIDTDGAKIDFSDWTRKVYTAIIQGSDGTELSAWPGSKWSMESLLKKRREMGERDFSSEYMNNPSDSERHIFQRSWLSLYKNEEFTLEHLNRSDLWIACDAASGTKATADYRAWILFARIRDPKVDWEKQLFVLEYNENRKPPDEVAAQIIKTMSFYGFKPKYVRSSKEGEGANWLETELRRQMKALSPPRLLNSVSILMPGARVGGKLENWDKCCAYAARMKTAIPESKNIRITELLCAFPDVDHDDLNDAYAVGMRFAEIYTGKYNRKKERFITGYEYDFTQEGQIFFQPRTYIDAAGLDVIEF